MKDFYTTIAAVAEAEIKEKNSKFIAYACPMTQEKELPERLADIRKLRPKATHYCYAYRLGVGENLFRANDDGEPSGTAGRPILGQIDRLGLTNVLVVVVRYYGGTQLGTSGLLKAYRESAALALGAATKVEQIVEQKIEIIFTYQQMSDVMNAVKKLDLHIVEQNFEIGGRLLLAVRQSEVPQTLLKFHALVEKISEAEASGRTEIEGVGVRLIG